MVSHVLEDAAALNVSPEGKSFSIFTLVNELELGLVRVMVSVEVCPAKTVSGLKLAVTVGVRSWSDNNNDITGTSLLAVLITCA